MSDEGKVRSKKKIDEEIVMILYHDGLNDVEIATIFSVFPATILYWRKKHNLKTNFNRSDYPQCNQNFSKNLKEIICPKCKKEFKQKSHNHRYCNDPCLTPAMEFRKKRYYLIRAIRHDFAKSVRHNPIKAKKLLDEMVKKEGPEFTEFALDGVFENEVRSDEAVLNRRRLVNWEKNLEKS